MVVVGYALRLGSALERQVGESEAATILNEAVSGWWVNSAPEVKLTPVNQGAAEGARNATDAKTWNAYMPLQGGSRTRASRVSPVTHICR